MTEKERGYSVGLAIVIILAISLVLVCFGLVIHAELTRERIVVEGTITSAEYIGELDCAVIEYDIIRVIFDDDETYDLLIGAGNHDFTVNSKLILKLKSYDDKWIVIKIIKVPGDV